jgi:hypothetical protein
MRPLGLYAVSRVVIYAAIGVVIMQHLGAYNARFTGPWPDPGPSHSLFEALSVWDGGWYLNIASHGYQTQLHPVGGWDPTVAFLPLLPLVIKAVSFVTGLKILLAGIFTVVVTGAIASVCVWLLVRRLTDVRTADRATALWCFFPGAITLSLVYSEGLLVILAVVCIFALMRERWLLAGIAALLAGATAAEGLALVLCCAWAAGAALLRQPRSPDLVASATPVERDGRSPTTTAARYRRPWLALTAPLLAPVGFVAYQAYLWRRTGDITYWYWAEKRFWNGGFNPWNSTLLKVKLAYEHPGIPDLLIPAIGLFVLVAAAILLWRWKPPAIVTIYAAFAMASVIASGALGARPRFFIAAFPFIVALARPAKGPVFQALLGVSAGCLALLTLLIVTANGSVPAMAFTP